MPEKHFYFSLGATVGAVACTVIAKKRHVWRQTSRFVQWLYRKEPQWFLYFPLVIFFVGLWGLVPDIVHLFGLLPKEETRSGLFDIFFFHSTFEHIENTFPAIDRYLNFLGQFLLAGISIGVMVYYVRQAKKAISDRRSNNQRKK